MTPAQIDSLRDLAIAHLPRAQSDRAQAQRYGGSASDFYRRLAVTAAMVRGTAGSTAIECASAKVLEAVCLLSLNRDEPLTTTQRAATLDNLVAAANELCALSGSVVTWLADRPVTPEPIEEAAKPLPVQSAPAIAGRFLTTKEAAKALGVAEQTLRGWASQEGGPIRPSGKVGRHNRWSGDEILALLKGPKRRGR